MSRTAFLFLALPGVLSAAAQDLQAIIARDALIDSLYEAERYAEVQRSIEDQIKAVPGTAWEDSLHRYLYKAGRAAWRSTGADACVAAAERIYNLVEQRGHVDQQLSALADLSWCYYDVGRIADCVRVDSLAVALSNDHTDVGPRARAKARQYLGFDHSIQGDHAQAVHFFLAAKAEYDKVTGVDAILLAENLTGIGASYWHLGRMNDAETYYQRAVRLLVDRSDLDAVTRRASVFGNLGVMWQSNGDLSRALGYYQRGIQAASQVITTTTDPFQRDEAIVNRARTYLNIATIYFELGDVARARSLLDLSWNDRAQVLEPDDPQLLMVKERMADLELSNGSLDRAEELVSSYLEVCEQRLGRRSEEYVNVCSKLGEIARRQGRIARADSLFQRSLEAGRSLGDPSTDSWDGAHPAIACAAERGPGPILRGDG